MGLYLSLEIERLGLLGGVAMLGAGLQGRRLLNCLLVGGNVKIRAVCDMWKYRRSSALAYLKTIAREFAITRGLQFSTPASLISTSRWTTPRPCGMDKSSERPRLLRFQVR